MNNSFLKMIKVFAIFILVVLLSCTSVLAVPSYGGYSKNGSQKTDNTTTVSVNQTAENEPIEFTFNISKNGGYSLAFEYLPVVGPIVEMTFELQIDGAIPFEEASMLTLPRIWNTPGIRTDIMGNEYAMEPVPLKTFYKHTLADNSGWSAEPYLFHLTAGSHTVKIIPIDGAFELKTVELSTPEQTETYQKMDSNGKAYQGENIVLQAEKSTHTNSYWISPLADGTSINATPSVAEKELINYIGGSNWSKSGDTVYWTTPDLKEGYYKIGFSYKQDSLIGSSVYRWLKIDGRTPFLEAKEVPFGYCYDWEKEFFENDKDEPYLIYLSAGKHEISLTATPGKILEVTEILKNTVAELSDLYVDITMVTGQTVDVNRDYDLFNQIPKMEERLKSISEGLDKSIKTMKKHTNSRTSSQISTLDNMQLIVKKILNNKYSAQKYISNYYSQYCAVSATLNEMRDMPLSIDSIVLAAPNQSKIEEKASFFSKAIFSVKKFLISFISDYDNISSENKEKNSIEVWVNWGRDQAQILDSLIQTTFTPHNDTSVNIKVVNASMVQAVLSGKGPDVFLQHPRSEPVNLAMRGVLYDLSKFSDCEDVLKRFTDGADTPYRYKGGLYALPDTQTFYVMYYRKDILEKLGLSVPETWDDFNHTVKQLSRNNLETWISYTQIADVNQANVGVGGLSLFPSLMIQNGLSLYSDDLHTTRLMDESTINVFTKWTDYYTKSKLPITMSFYNRFRAGTCPLGIDSYLIYNQFKAAATEIDGLWGVSPLPGTVRKDGTVSHESSGGGTGCGILSSSKNPQIAWEFLKWWTNADTQLSFSNNVESVLGPTARIAVSNKEAFSKLSWDVSMKENMIVAEHNVVEIPEVPGSYYTSRAIDHSFWNVANANKKPKNMLLQWGEEANLEIERKWNQYENR